mgnify:CR=1 FL=1
MRRATALLAPPTCLPLLLIMASSSVSAFSPPLAPRARLATAPAAAPSLSVAPPPASRAGILRGGEAAASTATPLARLRAFIDKRFFLVGVVAAVGLAALTPTLGCKGGLLRPELTVNWGATGGIFLIAGLTLPTSQLAATAVRVRAHAAIQAFNLLLVPLMMLGVCSALGALGLLPAALADGLLVMAALPTTVNMCVALTRSAGGNEALAIFNAVVGNLAGVLLTPWVLTRLVASGGGGLAPGGVLRTLSLKVLLPLVAGQVLRRLPAVASVAGARKKLLSRTSESLLLLTVYSTFCDTFLRGAPLAPLALVGLLGVVLGAHAIALAAAWALSVPAVGRAMVDRVAFVYCATQKSLALGLPLLRILLAGRADLALLCTPLLLQHPLQLIVGSFLQPLLAARVERDAAPPPNPKAA